MTVIFVHIHQKKRIRTFSFFFIFKGKQFQDSFIQKNPVPGIYSFWNELILNTTEFCGFSICVNTIDTCINQNTSIYYELT